jgi:hypothetical protein
MLPRLVDSTLGVIGGRNSHNFLFSLFCIHFIIAQDEISRIYNSSGLVSPAKLLPFTRSRKYLKPNRNLFADLDAHHLFANKGEPRRDEQIESSWEQTSS